MAIKKAKNGTWYFNNYIGKDPLTNKDVTVTRRGFESKAEAEKELNKIKYEFDLGQFNKDKGFTYTDVYNIWIKLYKETVKESTYKNTLIKFKNHILPFFGDMKIKDISVIHCQEFANKIVPKIETGYIIYVYAKKLYTYAKNNLQLVDGNNPFNGVIIPKVIEKNKSNRYQFLEKEELKLLLKHIEETLDYNWYVYFRLLAYSGMRKSEALALSWSDIDFKNKKINIDKTLILDINNNKKISTPKTRNSIRVIEMDNETLSLLAKWKKLQSVKNVQGVVFTNNKGDYTATTFPNSLLKFVCKKYNFKKISCHAFRHTHCSHLFASKADIKYVQKRLGHASINTTLNIYRHVTKEEDESNFRDYINYMIA